MCRYGRRSEKQKIADISAQRQRRLNCQCRTRTTTSLPTTHQPIIRQSRETGERELILARWGLVPFFSKDLKDIKGLSTINARAETITKARTWREPFKKRRCLIPASFLPSGQRKGSHRSGRMPLSLEMAVSSRSRGFGMPGKTRMVTGSSRMRS